jgi:hypothetical protein
MTFALSGNGTRRSMAARREGACLAAGTGDRAPCEPGRPFALLNALGRGKDRVGQNYKHSRNAARNGEGSIPVPLPPPARFGAPYSVDATGPKSRRYCQCFFRENVAGGSSFTTFDCNLKSGYGNAFLLLEDNRLDEGRALWRGEVPLVQLLLRWEV